MTQNKYRINNFLKKQIKFVCDTEMESLKPGNVHKYASGHNMNSKDFLKSSLIISRCLTNDKLDLGQKILVSTKEIKNKIKKNTNLGIILMLSPIVAVIDKIIGICFLSNKRYIHEKSKGIKLPPVNPCIALKATIK